MVHPQLRARTLRKVQRRTPGGKTVENYVKRKPSRARCSACGEFLKGIPNIRASKLRSINASRRKVHRPFGNQYCSSCSREAIKARIRPL